MRFDGAIGFGVGHAGQHKTGFDLVVIQEALVRLIDSASGKFAGASGAGPSSAGIWKINALLFSRVEDVLVIGDIDGFVEALRFVDQGDLVGSSHGKVD